MFLSFPKAHENVVLEVDEDYRRIKAQVATGIKDARRRFVEGPFLTETLEYMIGVVVYTADDIATACGPKLYVYDCRQLPCGTEFIRNISTNKDGTAWIHQNKSTKNILIDSSGQVKNELEMKFDTNAFVVLNNGDYVFTCFGGKEIRKISPTGHITVVCSTAPLFPRGISISRDGQMSSCDVSSITRDSSGEVHLRNISGKVVRKYSADVRTKLFTSPHRVVENVNLDLVVMDTTDKEYSTRVVGVTVDGRVRFTYTGQVQLEKTFVSADACCDQHGRIMLADLQNDCIHVLSADGHFRQYILTAQDGLLGPRSLAHRDDTLWVGCEKGVVRVVKLRDNIK